MEPDRVALVTLGGLAVVGGGVGLYFYLRSDTRDNSTLTVRERVFGLSPAPPPTPDRMRQWLGTRGEIRPLAAKPPTARRIPVVARAWIPMIPRETRTGLGSTASGRLSYLNGLRSILAQAGRSDEDPRCVMNLMAIESAWDTAGWNCNYGNVKSQGSIYADATTLLGAEPPYVWTSNSEANGVFLLTDHYNSFDGYHSFPNAAVYMRRHGALLSHGYPEVIAGYRQGGLDGLLHAEEFLARRGYAERPYDGQNRDPNTGLRLRISMQSYVFARQQEARGYWQRCQDMLGSAWVR